MKYKTVTAQWIWDFLPYSKLGVDLSEVNKELVEAEEDGWNLVSVIPHPHDSYHVVLFLKKSEG